MKLTTSWRERRTSTSPVTQSVCFQRMPASSSWMQIAFSIVVGFAVLAGDDRVEVDDLAEAVAAQAQRVGQLAEAELAGVEGAAPEVFLRRVAVGHDHLAERGAVQHRAVLAAVLVLDGVSARGPRAGAS